jgi:8-oxo-dGTP pyrophosphatase MutT (NUDIX family)
MKILATFDAKDYRDTTSVYEKYSVRAIIMREGKLAMQCSRDGEYKIPGGGLETGEDYIEALIREVSEETGLCVIRDGIAELGEIVEMRKDIFDPNVKYICHSIFYYCEITGEQHELRLTASEIAKGYELKWATPEDIYNRNILIEKDPWIVRDTAFVKMIMDGGVALG